MPISSTQLLNEVYEAQQRSLQALLTAWDQELQQSAELFRENKQRQLAQELDQARSSAAAEGYLNFQVAQAMGGADISISIPSGVRVATGLITAAVDADLQSLFQRVLGDPDLPNAQQSVLWSLGHGLVPHPSDLASLMDRRGVDQPWSERLHHLGSRLEGLGPRPLPQLQAGGKLEVVKGVVSMLKAYPGDRLLDLTVRPEQVSGSIRQLPPLGDRAPRVRQPVLNRALDQLLARAR